MLLHNIFKRVNYLKRQKIDASHLEMKMEDFSNLDLVEFETFKRITSNVDSSGVPKEESHSNRYDICSECKVSMNKVNDGYECPSCHIVNSIEGDIKDCSEDSFSMIRTRVGQRSIVNSATTNYERIQRRTLVNQLHRLNEEYNSDNKIPRDVINNTARLYNEIQKLDIDCVEDGVIVGQKKFVRRGNVKDEILGACLYYESLRSNGVARTKKDIAKFMKLKDGGISRGEEVLRKLHNSGKINIPMNIYPIEDFVERYLRALDLLEYAEDRYHFICEDVLDDNSKRYKGFVVDLVEASRRKKVGIKCVLNTKIAGSIWVLVYHEKVHVEPKEMEKACDGVKKNTFMKFFNLIEKNIKKFVDVFEKYGVKHGVDIK